MTKEFDICRYSLIKSYSGNSQFPSKFHEYQSITIIYIFAKIYCKFIMEFDKKSITILVESPQGYDTIPTALFLRL